MRLVKDDYLGGGGSRGNGQVNLYITGMEARTLDYYKEKTEATSLIENVPEDLTVNDLKNV